jgi:hypothetical protein
MKKFVSAAFVVCLIMVSASMVSAANQKNTGCGLGSLVMQGNDGLLFQILAVTTNGTFGNQTFGITSGTLNCDQPKRFVSREQLNNYVADNMDNLANDISKGQGEYLNTLAVLMEVPEGTRSDFYAKLQSNFSRIYPTAEVKSTDVLNNIENLM